MCLSVNICSYRSISPFNLSFSRVPLQCLQSADNVLRQQRQDDVMITFKEKKAAERSWSKDDTEEAQENTEDVGV